MRRFPFLSLALLLSASPALAQPCPLPGQKPLLNVRFYFGLTDQHGKPITDAAWRDFLARIVTPRFSLGFTVYDVRGQWQDRRTRALAHENTRVLEIAAEDTPLFRRQVGEIARDYRDRFRLESVGIVSAPACGAF